MRLIGLDQCFQGVDQGVQSERLISPVLVGNEGATRKISRGRPPTLDPLSPPYPSQPQPHAPPLTQRLGHIIQLVLGAADQHHGESSASQLQYSTMSLTHTDKQPHSASVCVRQTDRQRDRGRERESAPLLRRTFQSRPWLRSQLQDRKEGVRGQVMLYRAWPRPPCQSPRSRRRWLSERASERESE